MTGVLPYPMGKFDSPRDDLLYSMCSDDWANQSNGDSEAPTGYFWLITNEQTDLGELSYAFSDEIEALVPYLASTADLYASVLGSFIVWTNDQGQVFVRQFEHQYQAENAYDLLVVEFQQWDDQSETEGGVTYTPNYNGE